MNKEQAQERAVKPPRERVREILVQYRRLKYYMDNAVYTSKFDFSELEVISDLMMPESKIDSIILSIQKGIAKTDAFVTHIDRMLDAYHAECANGNDLTQRRWHILELSYLGEKRHEAEEIASIEHISKRAVYYDLNRALDDIAVLFFGVDGIRR